MTNDLEPRGDDGMIERLAESAEDLASLAAQQGLTLSQLAAWASEPGNRRQLEGLCVLGDVQLQLLLNRYRTMVVTRLIELATKESAGETARRACIDLLKLNLKPPAERASVDGDAGDELDASFREVFYKLRVTGGKEVL